MFLQVERAALWNRRRKTCATIVLSACAGRRFLFWLPTASPILAHPSRNLLAFRGVHGLAAPALSRLGQHRCGASGPLQFLQRGNHAIQLSFFGVQVLNRFIYIHRITTADQSQGANGHLILHRMREPILQKPAHSLVRKGRRGTSLITYLVMDGIAVTLEEAVRG